MRKILCLLVIIVTTWSNIIAQDSTKKNTLNITGSIDTYYRYNLQSARDSGVTNNYTSFTNSHNSFELGMASIKAEYTTKKVTGLIDLGFGRRADDFSYNDKGAMTAIKQAYVSIAATEQLKFTAGKWVTHCGYEYVDAYLNRNYSTSYMFSYGPFFHTGVKAEYTLGQFGFMVGIANPTAYTTTNVSSKMVLGQISWINSKNTIKSYLNYQGGKDILRNTINQVDLVINDNVTDKFSLGFNGTIQSFNSDIWWGSALYINTDFTKTFGLTLREEYFNDDQAIVDFGTSVLASTLSGNIRIDNLTIIPEIKLNNAKNAIFSKNTNQSVRSTETFILAATWHF